MNRIRKEMGNSDLAEESRKVQKLRDKLRIRLDLVEQKIALKNKVIKSEKEGQPTKAIPEVIQNWVFDKASSKKK